MAKVKITVVKRDLYKDLAELYAANPAGLVQCPLYADNQEFVLENTNMPEGFCSWAWADIQRDVVAIASGANYRWIKDEGCLISCCTDGLRPVVFKIERID